MQFKVNLRLFKNWFLFNAIFTAFEQLRTGDSTFTEQNCATVNITNAEHCQCSLKNSHQFHVKCNETLEDVVKNNYTEINVIITNLVEIECLQRNRRIHEILPNVAIEGIQFVSFKGCEISFSETLDRLGLTNITSLASGNANLGNKLQCADFGQLRNLRNLNLAYNFITEIPQDIFEDLYLLNLNLARNQISNLTAGTFSKQNRLRSLSLAFNQLSNLNSNSFDGLDSLTLLDLQWNNIDSLPENIFAALASLEILNLNNNHLNQVPARLFTNNRNLQRVSVIKNEDLNTLPSGFLSHQTNLESLDLSYNNLHSLPKNLLQNTSKLEYLNLSDNYLKLMPNLMHLLSLKQIDLSHNKVNHVDYAQFKFIVDHAIKANLSYNRVHLKDSKTLKYLRDTQEEINVNLYGNNQYCDCKLLPFLILIRFDKNQDFINRLNLNSDTLICVGPGHFYGKMLNDIEFLDLECTEKMPKENGFNSNTTELIEFITSSAAVETKINSSIATTYSSELGNNTNAIAISTESSTISSLELDYSTTGSFTTLDDDSSSSSTDSTTKAETNESISLAFESSSSSSFTSLNSDSSFNTTDIRTTITDFIIFPDITHTSDFTTTSFSTTSESTTSTTSATADIEEPYTCITNCSCSRSLARAMIAVNCSSQRLSNVNLKELPAIQEHDTHLNIENNQFLELPVNTTPGYENVIAIYAANNNISRIDINHLPQRLQYVDLRHNQVQHLDSSVLKYLESNGVKLYLSQNPWNCDCSSSEFLQFTLSNQKLLLDWNEVRCSDGRAFQELRTWNICATTIIDTLVWITCILGVLFCIIGIIFYKWIQYL